MLTINPASPHETDTVIAILTDAAHWLQSRGLAIWDIETLPAVMNPPITRGEVYVACLNDQPVATITVQWSDPFFWGERPDDAGYIHKLAVMRTAAGQQIGARVLSWAEALIAEHGRPYARLDCHAENPVINRFYQTAGYQVRGFLKVHDTPFNLCEKLLS